MMNLKLTASYSTFATHQRHFRAEHEAPFVLYLKYVKLPTQTLQVCVRPAA